ncbi:uncharacterized protein [Penaeus vannamei]|uniref:uncharacterized protein n=1 Tax=Penaeus vannamei TaxID=6689 RepID=UPI00387F8DB4
MCLVSVNFCLAICISVVLMCPSPDPSSPNIFPNVSPPSPVSLSQKLDSTPPSSPTATSVFLSVPTPSPVTDTLQFTHALPPYVPPTSYQDASSSQPHKPPIPPKLNLPPKPHPSLLSLPLPPGYTHKSLLSQYPSPDPTIPIESPDTTPPIPDPLSQPPDT